MSDVNDEEEQTWTGKTPEELTARWEDLKARREDLKFEEVLAVLDGELAPRD